MSSNEPIIDSTDVEESIAAEIAVTVGRATVGSGLVTGIVVVLVLGADVVVVAYDVVV